MLEIAKSLPAAEITSKYSVSGVNAINVYDAIRDALASLTNVQLERLLGRETFEAWAEDHGYIDPDNQR